MLRLRRLHCLQRFAAVHGSVFNGFNADQSLSNRDDDKRVRAATLAEWRTPWAD
jgi:hypothetical protein